MNFSLNSRPFKKKIDELKVTKSTFFVVVGEIGRTPISLTTQNVNKTFALEMFNILGLNASSFIFCSTGLKFCVGYKF